MFVVPSPDRLLVKQRLTLGPRRFIVPTPVVGDLVACGEGPFLYGMGEVFPAYMVLSRSMLQN